MLLTTYVPGTVLVIDGDNAGPVIVLGSDYASLTVRRRDDPSAPLFRVSPYRVTRAPERRKTRFAYERKAA
jgi:hypothetical protein